MMQNYIQQTQVELQIFIKKYRKNNSNKLAIFFPLLWKEKQNVVTRKYRTADLFIANKLFCPLVTAAFLLIIIYCNICLNFVNQKFEIKKYLTT